MKIDITKPQPCPVCGAEMMQYIYGDEWFCSNDYCGMADAAITLRELNTLALRARLGEVDEWWRKCLTGEIWRNGYPGLNFDRQYYRFLICVDNETIDERAAILNALEELEAQV